MPDFRVNTSVLSANATKAAGLKRTLNTQSYELSRISFRLIGVTMAPVRAHLLLQSAALRKEGRRLGTLSTTYGQVAALYVKAEKHIREYNGALQNPAFTNGEYGGDQGSPRENWEDVADIVRKYHPDWSDKQVKEYLEKLNEEGCGYIALVNTIFLKYKGREDEFEKTFGFPMYDKNGKLNYNALVTDLYTSKDDPNSTGTTRGSREPMWEEYCREHGIKVDVRNVDVTAQNYKQLVKDGQIIVGISPVYLYDKDGKRVFSVKDAGHAMTVTGVTDDGRLIVSSWGKTYYLDKDLSNYNGHCTFQQVVYE